jgi:hypothetical protein
MKTKMLMIFLTASIMLLNVGNCKSQPQNKSSDEEIRNMLKSFYTSYIRENVKMPPNGSKISSVKMKYCTMDLLDKINNEELDFDPFLKAQDSNIDWIKTLIIKKDSSRKDLYDVSYIDNNKPVIVKLNIIKQNKSFKIDSIW